MISTAHKFIYIHIPKTGGTSIQTILLPFSDDEKVLVAHQDGVERFGLKGAVTPEKHATLQDYSDRLGDAWSDYKLVLSVRHPFERAVSGYFPPHKWMQQDDEGRWISTAPYWDEGRFFDLLKVRNHRPATAFITVDGRIATPALIIRHEYFERDVSHCIRALGLPLAGFDVPKRNASTAPSELKREVLSMTDIRDRVEAIYHADMEYFRYAPYQPE